MQHYGVFAVLRSLVTVGFFPAPASRLVLGIFCACASSLAGCSPRSGPYESEYPSIASITGLGRLLSDEERQKTVEELETQEKNHSAEAEKAITQSDQTSASSITTSTGKNPTP